VFGLGEYARRMPDQAFSVMSQCLEAVNFVLTRKFEDEEVVNCYDNSISTLGKLIYFKG
jgi:hypothetical protein